MDVENIVLTVEFMQSLTLFPPILLGPILESLIWKFRQVLYIIKLAILVVGSLAILLRYL